MRKRQMVNSTTMQSLKTEIDRLETLTERQKEVICYFFGIGVDHPISLEDIGESSTLQGKGYARSRIRPSPN